MIRLLADVNVQRQVEYLASRLRAETWHDFYDYLDLRFLTFADLGLLADDADSKIWLKCQDEQVFLVTNNRNDDGPDSLESTIRTSGTSQSLPVFTFGDANKILKSASYAEEVIESLLDYLLRIESLRGAGRLFLPQ